MSVLTDEQCDAILEAAEDTVGMGHGAWDMVPARDLVRAVVAGLAALRAPIAYTTKGVVAVSSGFVAVAHWQGEVRASKEEAQKDVDAL